MEVDELRISLHPSSSAAFDKFPWQWRLIDGRKVAVGEKTTRKANKKKILCRSPHITSWFNLKSVKIQHLLGHAFIWILLRLLLRRFVPSSTEFSSSSRHRCLLPFLRPLNLTFFIMILSQCFGLLFNPSSFYHSFLPFHRRRLLAFLLLAASTSNRARYPRVSLLLRLFSSFPEVSLLFGWFFSSLLLVKEKNTTSELKKATDLRIGQVV